METNASVGITTRVRCFFIASIPPASAGRDVQSVRRLFHGDGIAADVMAKEPRHARNRSQISFTLIAGLS
jgi:hypothetical protein